MDKYLVGFFGFITAWLAAANGYSLLAVAIGLAAAVGLAEWNRRTWAKARATKQGLGRARLVTAVVVAVFLVAFLPDGGHDGFFAEAVYSFRSMGMAFVTLKLFKIYKRGQQKQPAKK